MEMEDDAPEPSVTDLEAPAKDAPVVRLVHSVIAAAIERGASDIHFDPTRGGHERALPDRRRDVGLDDDPAPPRRAAASPA